MGKRHPAVLVRAVTRMEPLAHWAVVNWSPPVGQTQAVGLSMESLEVGVPRRVGGSSVDAAIGVILTTAVGKKVAVGAVVAVWVGALVAVGSWVGTWVGAAVGEGLGAIVSAGAWIASAVG